jgi:hypothetical protein
MPTSRTRKRTLQYPAGGKLRQYISGSLIIDQTQTAATNFSSQCDDFTGKGVDHNLTIERWDQTAIQPLNGRSSAGTSYKEFINWFPSTSSGIENHLTDSLPSNTSVATSTLAASNPSRPYISVPNFVYELKDLPEMIRDIGKIKLYAKRFYYRNKPGGHWKPVGSKDIANHYLSGVMGWSPLISDIRKLLDFQAKVTKRMRELDRLFNDNKGLHRKVHSPSWVQVLSDTRSVTVDSSLSVLTTCRVDRITRVEKWGSTRWSATALPLVKYNDKQLHSLALSLVLGLNANPKALWDALPWSWMIDWFVNVGTYLQAHTNIVPVIPQTPCVMVYQRTTASYVRTDTNSWLRGGDGSKIHETKLRFVGGSGTLSASIPFMGSRELSILGALAVQRFVR